METALVLAAGQGTRLRPFTDDRPKCLVPVLGVPILERACRAFEKSGIQHVLVVAGYKCSVVQDWAKAYGGSLRVEMVENAQYATTNSMYSLHLGLERIRGGAWLVEGDIVFDPSILSRASRKSIGWVVDSTRADLDGAYLKYDEKGRILELQLLKTPPGEVEGLAKSVGLIRAEAEGVDRIRGWLREAVARGDTNEYCDTIYARHIAETEIEALDVRGAPWMEVDNAADLKVAERMFGPGE